MTRLYTNSASTTLSATYTTSDTTITVVDGSRFASPISPDFQAVTFEDTVTGQFEIAHVTARSGNILTVTRGEEGTLAMSLPQLDVIVEARLTADALDGIFQADVEEISIGSNSVVAGNDSVGVGKNTIVSGSIAQAFGAQSTASGAYATAVGFLANASNFYNIALGYANASSGAQSAYSIGASNTNSASESKVYGTSNSVTAGADIAVLGDSNSITTGNGVVVAGDDNTLTNPTDVTVLGNDNTLDGGTQIVVGNGVTMSTKSTVIANEVLGEGFCEPSVDKSIIHTGRSVVQRARVNADIANTQPAQTIANMVTASGSPIDVGVPLAWGDLTPSAVDDQTIWTPSSPAGNEQYYAYSTGTDSSTGQAGTVTYTAEPTGVPRGGFSNNNVSVASGYTSHIDPDLYYITVGGLEDGSGYTRKLPFVLTHFGIMVYQSATQSGTMVANLLDDLDVTVATLSFTLTAEGGQFYQVEQVTGRKSVGGNTGANTDAYRYRVEIQSTTLTDYCHAQFFISGTLFERIYR